MERSIVELASGCATHLQAAAADRGAEALVERDFQRAMETVSGTRSAPLRLDHWPSVGRVDLMLPGQVAVELKWCKGGNTLANCAWDVAKIAAAVAEGQATAGYIVAGAPATHWDSAAPGVALFEARTYEDDELVRLYESWWRFWCRDVITRPTSLPRGIVVTPEGHVDFRVGEQRYVVRAARVRPTDPRWRPHVCPHRWRGEACDPRPWDDQEST